MTPEFNTKSAVCRLSKASKSNDVINVANREKKAIRKMFALVYL